ncbi:hypothetical protein B0T16DRAFT_202992 [Cercophora newfieldiana]|uniref:Uncharacterized protein n=1 Tax=Cercophora newfieldiana TaxID=92897 RepID=A0AA39XV67_9PEZI|nr:hypothetical protein B0T16DRAFT_202992 [Cercophora newfieldiana]
MVIPRLVPTVHLSVLMSATTPPLGSSSTLTPTFSKLRFSDLLTTAFYTSSLICYSFLRGDSSSKYSPRVPSSGLSLHSLEHKLPSALSALVSASRPGRKHQPCAISIGRRIPSVFELILLTQILTQPPP